MKKLWWLIGLICILGCQQKPTVVSESYPVLIRSNKDAIKWVLKGPYSLVDVRTPFEYQSKSHAGSVPIWWEDETIRQSDGRRTFDDSQKIANRWALKGLTPNKPVLLVTNSETDPGYLIVRCLLRDFGFQEVYPVPFRDIRSLNIAQPSQIEEAKPWAAENIQLSNCM